MTTTVSTHNGRILAEALTDLSSCRDWEQAKREWELEAVHLLDADDEPRRCLCSHYPIRELCTLRNRETGHRATVGNKCVRQFLDLDDADDIVASLRRVRDRPDSASMSAAAARFAYGRGWLTDWELTFCLNIAGRRRLSGPQRSKRSQINRLVVYRIRQDATTHAEDQP